LSIKGISFDFWNTLFKEPPGAFRFYKERRRLLLAEACSGHRSVTRAELDDACRVEREAHERVWQEEHRTLSAAERVAAILSELNVSLTAAEFAELTFKMEEIILEQPPHLVYGAAAAVCDLSKRYRMGIISDVGFSPGRVLKRLLAENGLLEAFDSLVFSDEAGCAKPHLRVFETTARSLDAEPRALVHIGDLERTDIIGAKQAGYRAIRFTGVTPMDSDESTVADRVTNDLKEVPRLVESLASP
jgi:putative hydrolase of the HAD superfamily